MLSWMLYIINVIVLWLWNFVSYQKGKTKMKGIWDQDAQENIRAQEKEHNR
jgi:hypothetical protein